MARAEDPETDRPARPPISNTTPAPIVPIRTITGAANVARMLWLVSFTLGLLGILSAIVFRDSAIAELSKLVVEMRDTLTDDEVQSVVNVIYFAALGAVGFITLIEMVLVRAMHTGRGSLRWALLAVVLLLHAPSAVLSLAFIAPGINETLHATFLWSQLVFAVAALVVGFLPSANRWFRSQHELRRAT
jgi:hypothetical protein